MLMVLVALALTLSLVAAVASNASADDSTIPDSGQGNWVRLKVPSAQDWQAAANPNQPSMDTRDCCITFGPGPVETGAALDPYTAAGCPIERQRWFCLGGYNNH